MIFYIVFKNEDKHILQSASAGKVGFSHNCVAQIEAEDDIEAFDCANGLFGKSYYFVGDSGNPKIIAMISAARDGVIVVPPDLYMEPTEPESPEMVALIAMDAKLDLILTELAKKA